MDRLMGDHASLIRRGSSTEDLGSIRTGGTEPASGTEPTSGADPVRGTVVEEFPKTL